MQRGGTTEAPYPLEFCTHRILVVIMWDVFANSYFLIDCDFSKCLILFFNVYYKVKATAM